MNLIRYVPIATKIRFMRWRRPTLITSAILTLLAAICPFTIGLNFGIDFQGGILMEVRSKTPPDLSEMRSKLDALGIGEVQLQEFGNSTDVLIRVQRQEGDEAAQARAADAVRGALGDTVEYRRVEYVGPKVSQELIRAGAEAVFFALLAIMVYIWFRFEWQFGVGGVLALTHDVLMTIGMFSVLQLEFNLTTVAAILTIAGYSINDSVVVYDRIRENLRKYKTMPIEQLIDLSLNETLSRTILTGGTTLIALTALLIFGGPVLRGFSFGMIFGILIGTYSSVYISAPVLLYLNLRSITQRERDREKAEKERAASP